MAFQRDHKPLAKAFIKGYFRHGLGGGGASELLHVQEWFIQNCLGTGSVPGPVPGTAISGRQQDTAPVPAPGPALRNAPSSGGKRKEQSDCYNI